MTRSLIGMLLLLAGCAGLNGNGSTKAPPNILLIMADDIGVEAFGSYGGESWQTPHLDALAAKGMRFTQCYSQPLCTPSRVKLMTGKSNLRNYLHFSILQPGERTFAHAAQNAGYATVAAGKWQLLGAEHYKDWAGRGMTPGQAGFDSWCLWQVTKYAPRYWNPRMEVDGVLQPVVQDGFGPDEFCDHLEQFIDQHSEQPFLAYFPMALVHSPFVHTPLTRTAADADKNHASKQERFGEMVAYMDQVVGRLIAHLEETGLRKNTLVIFLSDNGTTRGIQSQQNGRKVVGGKALPTNAGTHVPLIASWPDTIEEGVVCDDLIDLSDFLPTLVDAMDSALPSDQICDGRSFLPQLLGDEGTPREHITIYSNPRPEDPKKNPRSLFARDKRFKLYDDGRLFDCAEDPLEENSLEETEHGAVRNHLQRALDALPPEPAHLASPPSNL